MFAVPENTVVARPRGPHGPLTLTALVRAALAAPPAPGRLLPLDAGGAVWVSALAPGQAVSTAYTAAQGAFAVLTGTLREHTADTVRDLTPGQVRVFGPGYTHEVRNPGPHPALAVHIQLGP
ncbi:MAG TPA: hypothetical protein VGD67_16570 [Pseudonocardiaceae bacterium]